ncbi:actin-related protein 3-like [Lathyrus oleraceus]|uniref:actin-related protein 3-like n=1 Tax=Pisum sativum TaxID=3888 RepID=UPI0021CE5A47|nr:actin-related protein 3-like [Pisum sativum]
MVPTVVAINKSLLNQSRSSSEGNWIAQHNVSVMVDLDFFIGDDALSKAWSSSTYSLTYPIKHGQVENRDAMELHMLYQLRMVTLLKVTSSQFPLMERMLLLLSGSSREKEERIYLQKTFFEAVRKVKEIYCYTCSDIVKEVNKHKTYQAQDEYELVT